jgi:hypothetical protein
VVDAAKEPTCTETGLTAGAHCEVCGKFLSSQEEISALGHDFVGFVCTRCGEKQFTNVAVVSDKNIQFHVEAQGDNLKYPWYASSDGITWSKTYLDGSTTDTLSFSVTAAPAAKVYKCVITDIGGNTVETGAVSVTVG